jgi:hypothetical protein
MHPNNYIFQRSGVYEMSVVVAHKADEIIDDSASPRQYRPDSCTIYSRKLLGSILDTSSNHNVHI